eukprot:403376465
MTFINSAPTSTDSKSASASASSKVQESSGLKKVLVYGSFMSGQQDFMIEVAAAVASKGIDQRQVYQILPEGSSDVEFVKSRGITPLEIPGFSQEYVDRQKELIKIGEVSDSTAFMKETLDYIFNKQPEFVKELKSMKFDMLLIERYEDQQFLANYLETPLVVKMIERVVEPIIIQDIGGNPSHSSQLSTLRNQLFGIQTYETLEDKQLSFSFRFLNFVSFFLHKAYLMPTLRYDLAQVIPDDFVELATTHRFPNMSLFTGVEGLNPPIAVPPALKYVYPRYKTQYQPQFTELSPELKAFLNDNNFAKGFALVSFGNQRQPSQSQLEIITEYMISNPDYGFIVTLSNPQHYSEKVLNKLTNPPHRNIFFTGFVPQITLLEHPKIKLFFTHGGLNSYYESIEAKKAMIIMPYSQDEQGNFICDFAHLANISSCVYTLSEYEIEYAVKRAEKRDYFQKKLTQFSKVSKKFAESKKDLNYWIDYCFKVGTNHLQMPQYHEMRIDQYYDLDLHFLFFSAITIALYLIYYIIKILIWIVKFIARKTCCKPKQQVADGYVKVPQASSKGKKNKME